MVEVVYSQFFSVFAHAEMRINDIPVARAQPDEQKTSNAPIREYLLPGRNSVSLHVWQDVSQTRWHPHMKLEARVAIFEDGDWLEFDGGRDLASLHPIFAPELRQVDVWAEFDDPLGENAGRYWGWSQAPVLDLATHGDAARAFALWLSERFAARDVAAFAPQFEHRAREDASVYPMVPFDLRMRWIAESFDGIADEAWAPMPPNADNIQLRPVAGGRLYQLLDKEGKTLLRTQDHTNETDNHVELPAMIGILNNAFRILR